MPASRRTARARIRPLPMTAPVPASSGESRMVEKALNSWKTPCRGGGFPPELAHAVLAHALAPPPLPSARPPRLILALCGFLWREGPFLGGRARRLAGGFGRHGRGRARQLG